MCDDHPGIAALERAATEGVLLRSPGRISDMAALLRGVERHGADIDGSAEQWARDNSPMMAYSVYGFDESGAWSCVYVCRYSGDEPVLVRPWRQATGKEPDVREYPYDPRDLSMYYGHGFDECPRGYEDGRVSKRLETSAADVPWSEWVENGDADDTLRVATRTDTLRWIEARDG